MFDLPSLDPLLVATASGFIALIFARAAYHKASDFLAFTGTLADYRIVPETLLTTVTMVLIVLEVLVAGGVLWSATRPVAALTGAGLLTAYAMAMAVPLSQGRTEISCGCGGAAEQLSPALLVRNGVLVAVAIVAALPFAGRDLTWFDYLAIPLGVLTMWLILEMTEHTMQTAAHIRSMRAQSSSNKEV
jgi:hypothetical protein